MAVSRPTICSTIRTLRCCPLAGAAEIELAELAGESWSDNDFARGWCRQNLLTACAAAGFRPALDIEAHDYRAAIAFVEAAVGITVMPALGAVHPPPGVAVVPVIRPRPVRSVHALVRDSVARTRAGATALQLLRRRSDELRLSSGVPHRTGQPAPR